VDVVSSLLAAPRIYSTILLGEDELPAPFPVGVRILADQCVGQLDTAISVSHIPLVNGLNPPQMILQGVYDCAGHCRHPVLVPFLLTNGDFAAFEIQVLDTQSERLEESQSAAVEQASRPATCRPSDAT